MLRKFYEGFSQHPWNLSCTLGQELPMRRWTCPWHPDSWEHPPFLCIQSPFFSSPPSSPGCNLPHINEPPPKSSSSQVNLFQRSHLVTGAMFTKLPLVHPCLSQSVQQKTLRHSLHIRSHPAESSTWIPGIVSPPVFLIQSLVSHSLLSSPFTIRQREFLKHILTLSLLCSGAPLHWADLYHGLVRSTLHIPFYCLTLSARLPTNSHLPS